MTVINNTEEQEGLEERSEICSRDTADWVQADIQSPNLRHCEQPQTITTRAHSDYFFDLFTNELIDHIVFHTNLYAAQKDINTTFSVTSDEIKKFFGICVLMGIIELPAIDDYWKLKTRIPQVAEIMSRDRFKLIRSLIHFNNNDEVAENTDRFYKIRPVIDYVRTSCLKISETAVQSVDEVMIAYKGTRAGNLRQYIASKPDKWGFKFFARASSDGIIHDILPYQGSITFEHINVDLSQNEKDMNVSSKVVITLAKSMSTLAGSCIYADNYFTSYSLVKHLKNEYNCMYTGTARENRIGNPGLRSTAEMNKKSCQRGLSDYKSKDGIIAVKWKDNKVVTLLSSACGMEPTTTISRYDKESKTKKEVPCPQIIKTYNCNMGGVDKSDMLGHLYSTPVKARRWYIPIFGYLIDLCICNAWLVYKRDCKILNEKNVGLKEFRLDIATAFLQNKITARSTRLSSASLTLDCPTPRQGQRLPAPSDNVRFDRTLNHLPVFTSQRLTCKFYSRQNNLHRTRWMCDVCKIALCLSDKSNCFRSYHQ